MPANTLDSFTSQIANWARQAIEQGRSPFRKVETALPLLTSGGVLQAPLVFWINRDSFMAGGLMVFPGKGSEPATTEGPLLAEALGLQYFVEWAERQINIWRISGDHACREETFSLNANQADQIEPFRRLLDLTLDKLKFLSVMASTPPEQLSASYLANLCRSAVQDTLPILEAKQRIAQEDPGVSATPWAFGKAYQTVVRLLTLTTLGLLPTAVQPNGLEKAIRFSLPGVPDILQLRLRFTEDARMLPDDAAVRFHHLLRRLQQLGMKQTWRRTSECLSLLLAFDGDRLAGASAAHFDQGQLSVPTLSVNLATRPTPHPETIEIAPEPLLAAKALIRHLEGWEHPILQSPVLFSLNLPQLPVTVLARLHQQNRPGRRQRQQFETALRMSWPSRRFSVAQSAPVWLFEALHLLGLCQPDGRLQLKVPSTWLTANWGNLFWGLICQDFSLVKLDFLPDQSTQLELHRSPQRAGNAILQGEATFHCDWLSLRKQTRSYLLACLTLSKPWLELLETGALRSYCEPNLPGKYPYALQFFFRHHPGRGLAELFDIPAELDRTQLADWVAKLGIPAPAEPRLERLENLLLDDRALIQGTDDGVEQITRLGEDFVRLPSLTDLQTGVQQSSPKRSRIPQNLINSLASDIFVDGIPAFPVHYLYDFFRPTLQHYSWEGELSYGQAFFDQIVLQDAAGNQLEIAGEPHAAGLWLVSLTGRTTVDYPVDPEICEAILIRYLQDLALLHQSLVRKVREQLTHLRQADNLIRRLWEGQRLPGWDAVEKVMALFPQQFGVK